MRRVVAACFATCVLVPSALALPIVPTSYDMANGSGQASGGTFNYWDRGYTGIGSVSAAGPKTTDGESLSGGLGDLTDGITTNQNWFSVENAAGTGPYVGWRSTITPNPTVLFRFGGGVLLTSITVHMDDADGAGGVDPAASIDISTDGVTFSTTPVVDPAGSDPFDFTINLGGLATDRLYVRFAHQNEWVFVDEVSFDGRRAGVPVPGSLALVGIGALALIARRRRPAR